MKFSEDSLLNKLLIHMQKYESQSEPQICIKVKSKLIICLNLKCKTLKNLEKNFPKKKN